MGGPLTLGVSLPSRGPLASPGPLRELAVRAEELGFAHGWVADHVVLPTHTQSVYPYAGPGARPLEADQPYTEPLTTLAYVAGVTERIGIGTRVLVAPLRHPVLAAKSLATLDHLSGGRLTVGIGVGWLAEEFELVGAPDFHRRGAVTDEYIALLRHLWTAEEPAFAGEFVSFSGARVLPRPARPGGPPLWVGGHSQAALRRAARSGDAWFPLALTGGVGLGPGELAGHVSRLRELTVEAGREPSAVGVSLAAPVRFGARERGRPLTGDEREIASDLRDYRRAGVDTFVAVLAGDLATQLAHMERFMLGVAPRLAG
jgi:probable F420-dependent oxidoreductase